MTSERPLPSAEILRRLGQADPSLYSIGRAPVQAVMTVADLSRSIASDPVEARAYKDLSVPGNPAPNERPIGFVQCRSAGGLVVEALVVEDPSPSGFFGPNNVSVTIATAVAPGWHGIVEDVPLDIGGVATRSRSFYCYTVTDRDPSIGNWEFVNNPAFGSSLRFYVPSGSLFVFQCSLVNSTMRCAFTWREIPEPIS